MAKFYVDSGSFRGIVDAVDAEMAAVWAVHRVMSSRPVEPEGMQAEQGLFRLADEIRLSERGFGKSDSVTIETAQAVEQWAQWVCVSDRMPSGRHRT